MKNRLMRVAAVALAAIMVLAPVATFAASFSLSFREAVAVNNGRNDNCRPITNTDYLNCQGVAFDTYTKKDGYSFNKSSTGGSYYELVHFTVDGDRITKLGKVRYAGKNVGHANDATIAKLGGKKYMFVAISGGKELSSKASNGKSTKVAVILMDDYNKGKSKVRACKLKVNKGVDFRNRPVKKAAFSGITYVGTKKVGKKKRPVFVLKDGLQFYAAYATVSKKGDVTLTLFDRARINKPKFSGSNVDPAAQGLTYHNKTLYIPYSGENGKTTDIKCTNLVGKITYSKLFKGSPGASAKNLTVYQNKTTSYDGGKALEKHIFEAIFFKTLEGKDNMFVSVNRGNKSSKASDIDYVLISNQNM